MITGRYRSRHAEAAHELRHAPGTTPDARRRAAVSSRARSARPARCCSAGCDRLSRTEWFPKVLGARRDGERGALAQARHVAQVDGAGVHRRGSLADVSQQWHRRARHRRSTARSPRTASPTTGWRSAVSSRSRARSRSPSCARCPAARRSRATIASRAGARSASGRARGSRRCSRSCRPKPEARYVVFYCADPMEEDGTRPLLREHRPGRRVPSADDPRLRAERRAAAGRQRRADPAARRAAARLQAREVRHAHRAGRRASRTSPAARAATGRTRATSGTRGFESIARELAEHGAPVGSSGSRLEHDDPPVRSSTKGSFGRCPGVTRTRRAGTTRRRRRRSGGRGRSTRVSPRGFSATK